MKNLKEEINKGLPPVGEAFDDLVTDLPDKFKKFFNSMAEGFEKFFTS